MDIEFLQDQEDIRPNRSKIIPKGKRLTVTRELGDKYVDLGVAKYVDVNDKGNNINRPLKKELSLNWWTNKSDTMKVGLVTIATTISLFIIERMCVNKNTQEDVQKSNTEKLLPRVTGDIPTSSQDTLLTGEGELILNDSIEKTNR